MVISRTLDRPATRRRSPSAADAIRNQRTRACFLRRSATADPITKARILDEIVLLNLPVAERLALRYAGRGVPSPDLVQVARLGLVQAVRRFDADTGSDFLSFAVLGELKRHFRDKGWAVRPPRRVQELQPRVSAATSELTQFLARTPTRAEVADYLGVAETAIVEACSSHGCFAPASLDRPLVQDSRTSPSPVDALGQVDPTLEWTELTVTLAPVFGKLSERDRLVLRLRLVDDMTQTQIGSIVGVTQMQVSRILARIMLLARDELAA